MLEYSGTAVTLGNIQLDEGVKKQTGSFKDRRLERKQAIIREWSRYPAGEARECLGQVFAGLLERGYIGDEEFATFQLLFKPYFSLPIKKVALKSFSQLRAKRHVDAYVAKGRLVLVSGQYPRELFSDHACELFLRMLLNTEERLRAACLGYLFYSIKDGLDISD